MISGCHKPLRRIQIQGEVIGTVPNLNPAIDGIALRLPGDVRYGTPVRSCTAPGHYKGLRRRNMNGGILLLSLILLPQKPTMVWQETVDLESSQF